MFEFSDWQERVDYVREMSESLRGQEINGWEFEYDQRSGSFGWHKDVPGKDRSVEVYATPWYEGVDGIAMTIMDAYSGVVIDVPDSIKFDVTGDVLRDAEDYLTFMTRKLRQYDDLVV